MVRLSKARENPRVRPKTNIVLIGMPGAGKSTLGVVLAKMTNKGFVDTDLLIQAHHGATLQEIIDQEGTSAFIQAENGILREVEAENTVIATGGSAVYSPEAMEHLAAIGTIVYLEISPESLDERLGDLDARGVVVKGAQPMSTRGIFEERAPLYEHYAEVTVNVDNLSITQAARKVIDAIC